MLKLFKLILIKDEHSLSMPRIFLTLLLSELDTSIYSKDEQLLNIKLISLILLVLKLDKFNFFKDEQLTHY